MFSRTLKRIWRNNSENKNSEKSNKNNKQCDFKSHLNFDTISCQFDIVSTLKKFLWSWINAVCSLHTCLESSFAITRQYIVTSRSENRVSFRIYFANILLCLSFLKTRKCLRQKEVLRKEEPFEVTEIHLFAIPAVKS